VSILNFFKTEIYELIPYDIPWWSMLVLSGLIIFFISYRNYAILHDAEILRYEFLTIATHKFRTPLTSIKWATQNLHNELTVEEKRNAVKQIEIGTERLIEVIDILVGLAKVDNESTYNLKSVSVREMIEESLQKYSVKLKENNIRLFIDIARDIPFITLDNKKIQFVIEILIQNALAYTPKNGSIALLVYKEKKSILLQVRDSGIGFTRHERNNSFVRFFRGSEAKKRDTEGMGLGLYIAQRIIKRHDGHLWVKSEGRNKGSTFYMRLPLRL